MKKFLLLVIVFVAAGFLAYKLLRDKPAQPVQHKDDALRISENPETFNVAFDSLLAQYFALRDALVNWDTLKADQAAYGMAARADSLPIRLIRADTAIVLTARSVAAELSGNAKGFSGERGIAGRRQSFNILTDNLYNLLRTVRFDKETIYHMRCPMAFQDSLEGFWLSDNSQIVNPYLGNKHPVYQRKMLGCGEIVDSFDLTKKH
ncbi:MAG TPA: DUF3347 domain-containing protein [Puia sp.]|jgi:hypothetical protein|nr:DUF3347 domain-containing protein [Puia sp.]